MKSEEISIAFAEWIGERGYKFIDDVAVWELNEQESDSTLSLFKQFKEEYESQPETIEPERKRSEWHSVRERPEDDSWILVMNEEGHFWAEMTDKDDYDFNERFMPEEPKITHWRYIDNPDSTTPPPSPEKQEEGKIEVYSNPECPFVYCDSPDEECKKQNHCHYVPTPKPDGMQGEKEPDKDAISEWEKGYLKATDDFRKGLIPHPITAPEPKGKWSDKMVMDILYDFDTKGMGGCSTFQHYVKHWLKENTPTPSPEKQEEGDASWPFVNTSRRPDLSKLDLNPKPDGMQGEKEPTIMVPKKYYHWLESEYKRLSQFKSPDITEGEIDEAAKREMRECGFIDGTSGWADGRLLFKAGANWQANRLGNHIVEVNELVGMEAAAFAAAYAWFPDVRSSKNQRFRNCHESGFKEGAKWAIDHPTTQPQAGKDIDTQWKRNMEYALKSKDELINRLSQELTQQQSVNSRLVEALLEFVYWAESDPPHSNLFDIVARAHEALSSIPSTINQKTDE